MTAIATPPSATATTAPAALPDPLSAPLRPRFYDGQYLSAEALALAQDYLRERLRRRNLYLHGSGVVCGLEVTCGPQPGFVTVAPGYAIDSCGEDVFVPNSTPFDVLGSLPPSTDDPCLRPTLVLETGLPLAAAASVPVRQVTVVEAETLVVDQTRTLAADATQLPVADADAAKLTAGQIVRLRDLADPTQTQYVQVTAAGSRTFVPALALDLDVAHVELRKVTLTAITEDPRTLVKAADAGADRLTISDATGIAIGDVLQIDVDGATSEWATVADERSQVLLYLGYIEEADALARAVPAGSCTANGHCEVGRIRETFALRLVRGEKPAPPPDLVDDIGTCVKSVLEESGIVATSQRIASEVEAADNWTDPQLYSQLSADFTALRDALHGIAGSGVNCRADEELEALEFPEAPVEGQERRFVEQLLQGLATLYVHAFELAWECACEALLVPCRACASTADADVLLACLTVDSRGVVDICNLERKHVKTFPALERWLSPFSRALVAPLNVALQRAGHHRELRGPGDLFEFICCQFDLEQWLRALVRLLLPKLQDTPTAVRKPFMSVRGAKRTGKVQLMATRKVFTATAQKIGKKVPDVADRIGSVAAVENLDEVQAAQAVANDTGLQVTGTQRLDASELYSFETLKATASALVTSKPVEIAYTPEGVAFLRTPIEIQAPAEPG